MVDVTTTEDNKPQSFTLEWFDQMIDQQRAEFEAMQRQQQTLLQQANEAGAAALRMEGALMVLLNQRQMLTEKEGDDGK